MIGTALAHYRITAALGAGGMGEVWRATDTKLDREVALKVLPPAVAADPDRLARFEREAKVLASLNHPNIAHLYGLETAYACHSERAERVEESPEAQSDAKRKAPSRASGGHSTRSSDSLAQEGDKGLSTSEVQRAPENSGGPSTPAPSDDASAQDDIRSVTFLVMELVEGEDLSARIARGPIPIDEVIPIALQIAEALEAAHEAGIVHRDLKPANIKLTEDGTVKVLDFGLAKSWENAHGDSSLSLSPTITQHATMEGVILGTAAYMSPEQARGKKVDRRADIWAFGVVLWEMLTGRRLFEGETAVEILGSIFRQEISFDSLPAATPPSLKAVVGRCLDRDPRTRLRDIGEARIMIAGTAAGPATENLEEAASAPSNRTPRRLAAVALIATGIAFGGVAAWLLKPAAAPATRSLALAAPAEIEGPRVKPRISPDGRMMSYFADGRLWLQHFDQLSARAVPESESSTQAAWSPDGSALVMAVRSEIRRVTLDGNSTLIAHVPIAIGDIGASLAWTTDNRIVYATGDNSIFEVPVTGGSPRSVLDPDLAVESDFHQPFALPDNRGILYVVHRVPQGIDTLEVLADGERNVVFREPGASLSLPVYSPTGDILFERSDAASGLWSLPFSLSKLEATGPAVLITAEGSHPGVARDGTLLYSSIASEGNHRLAFAGLDGVVISEIGEPVQHADNAQLSPDGKSLAVCIVEGSDVNLWVYDLELMSRNRLVFQAGCGGRQGSVAWVPDGSAIVFGDTTSGAIRVIRTDGGSGEASVLAEGLQPEVSPDGQFLIYSRDGDLWYRPMDGSSDPRLVMQTPEREELPRISPSGDLLAYLSTESGRTEVFVRRFPSGDGRWQVSEGGGDFPRWSKAGDHLYYIKDEVLVMEVDVTTKPMVRMSGDRELFSAPLSRLGPNHGYDITADGRQFVMVHYGELRRGGGDLILVTNWK